ncbi:hypothetical protein [Pseudoxanthomonas sacheonensis]|uniref:hypothetical protein n=1 Tax=Pseudoxanthomonas sacheonensis TaxID=443615 RepID=UPI0013D13365|nr:hypothetical protein [Pseudoxanthomonas sacheonensis]
MKRGSWWGLVLAIGMFVVTGLASAQESVGVVETGDLRNQVVGSMRLTGTLAIGADGKITGYAIDHSEKVPPEVLRHVARYVPRWRVVKKDGGAGNKRFSVRVMATPRGDGYFALSLVGASIMEKQRPEEAVVADGRLRRPQYPRSLGHIGVSGTVYVVAKVGRDGEVEDLVTEQVNLNFVGSPAEVAKARADFAAHTAAAVRQWKFRFPKVGPLAGQPYLVVRVPMVYVTKWPGYAEWEYYVPGPRRAVPWVQQEDGMALGAGEAGVPQVLGMGPRMETSLEPPAG